MDWADPNINLVTLRMPRNNYWEWNRHDRVMFRKSLRNPPEPYAGAYVEDKDLSEGHPAKGGNWTTTDIVQAFIEDRRRDTERLERLSGESNEGFNHFIGSRLAS